MLISFKASDMVSGFSPYYLNAETKTYDQPEFVSQLLQQFKSINARQLSNVMMSRSYESVATRIPGQRKNVTGQKLGGMSLEALCDYGIKNSVFAISVWNILMKELTSEATSYVKNLTG
jgi:hypothetical protein